METWIMFKCENGHIFSIRSDQITENTIVICPICEYDIVEEHEIKIQIIEQKTV